MGQKNIWNCDICGIVESDEVTIIHNTKVPCRFVTDQTEGRSITPRLAITDMDVCTPCYQKVIDGQPLVGAGAMGYNDYNFPKGV